MQLNLVFDDVVTVPAGGVSVVGLMVGVAEHAFFLSSVRNLGFAQDAQSITWYEAAISMNQFGGGGRELVITNNTGNPIRAAVKAYQLIP